MWKRTIKQDGTEEFEYVCKGDETKNNQADTFFFWWSQYICTIAWAVFLFLKSFTAQFFVVLVPAVLSIFNLYAYFMCSKEKQKQVDSYVAGKKQEATSYALNEALKGGAAGGNGQGQGGLFSKF